MAKPAEKGDEDEHMSNMHTHTDSRAVASDAATTSRAVWRRRSHRFAIFLAGWILCLIFLGGQVKSTNSGLSVPDWPNTYNHFMFSFPWEKMVGGIFWEHLHRMVASFAGLFTFALTIMVYRFDPRRWVRSLAVWASVAVLAQGVLGGMTVLFMLPAWISTSHGTLAQIYLSMVVLLAMVTSASWVDGAPRRPEPAGRSLRRLALATTVVIALQLIIGAVMRHSEAGLAIPDFPTMFGSWLPPLSDSALASANRELIALDLEPVTRMQMLSHLLHRLGALVVSVMVVWSVVRVMRNYRDVAELRRPAWMLLALLVVQATLGILTILTEKQFTITSFHVVNGAATLVTSLMLTVRARHLLGDTLPEPAARAVPQGSTSVGEAIA